MRPAPSLILAAALAPALLTGCSRPGLVGKWQGSVPYGRMSLPITMDFRPDGTETQATSVQTPAGQMNVVASGTYTVEGGATLRMTQTGVTINGRPGPTNARLAQGRAASFKVDGDTLTITAPGAAGSLTLTRVKA